MNVIFFDSRGNRFRSLLLSIFLVIIIYCSFKIYTLQGDRQVIKEDLVELSKIKYGLFSVDEWKNILADILSKKIEELNFSADQKIELKAKVSAFLSKTIAEMEERFHKEESQSLGGWLKIGVADLTGMFDHLKKDVPIYTEQILDFLNDPGNREKVKGYIMEKLSEYTDKTFSKIDYTEHNRIIAQYKFADRHTTISGLKANLDQIDTLSKNYVVSLFALILLSALLILLTSSIPKAEFFLYTLICFCLLFSGLMLPMIEIDARISEISFTLLGEPISFTDQVLYYKSKSILEVVRLMLTQGKPDVLAVGFLVLLFSVLFPVVKLISSLVYIYNERLQSNRFIRFMVFRTGKWSMADVMVVAIFMSYIGFSGILTEQLHQLSSLTTRMDILTTNKSSLQLGFFLFTSFAILSLLVSQLLQYINKKII